MLNWLKRLWTWIKGLFGSDPPPVAAPWNARLMVGAPMTVAQFADMGATPGDVGICLSGGGSRALTGAMGQLRALRSLKTSDGRDLISQARALSTVSGGSWLGVTFEYLTSGVSDDAYLNELVSDPGRLVPGKTAGHSVAETLDALPDGNIGNSIASRSFNPVMLAIEVLLLHEFVKVPIPFLWQTAVALHILKPYGLFPHSRQLSPTSLFSFDQAVLQRDVTGPNPGLSAEVAHLFASGAGRSHRPFLVCNMAMFLKESGTDFDSMTPVQATAFNTGIFGRPQGTDANGLDVGGGGVTSFAFNSALNSVSDMDVQVEQTRQLSLMDIVGTSSAFYAEVLQNLYAAWRADVDKLLDEIIAALDDIIEWVEKMLPIEHAERAKVFLKHPLLELASGDNAARDWARSELQSWLDEIRDLTPEYLYWPVLSAAPAANIKPTRFADGGDLENTGVASLLSYGDIDRVISFVTSSQPMAACSLGMFDAQGTEIPGTRVLLDSQMAVLFGYQPWQKGLGYRLYAGATNPAGRQYRNNQVFRSEHFAELLKGFWAVTGNTCDPASLGATGSETRAGVNLYPAVLRLNLETVPNRWFGVAGDKKIGIVWSYTNRVRTFYDSLSPEVRAILGDFDDPASFDAFPHYSTFRTQLTATQINLLASLTAWSVANPHNQETFLDLFAGR
jgi:hypothetical protein